MSSLPTPRRLFPVSLPSREPAAALTLTLFKRPGNEVWQLRISYAGRSLRVSTRALLRCMAEAFVTVIEPRLVTHIRKHGTMPATIKSITTNSIN